MQTHTNLVNIKRRNTEFWDMLDAERIALCRSLADDGDCPELLERLQICSTRRCGLAACPACMARADQRMFRSIQKMCHGGETIFVRIPDSFGLPERGVELVPAYLKGVGDLFEFNKVDVDSYIGRYFFQPAALELDNGEVDDYGTGFVGAMRLTDFYIDSSDDLVKAAEFADSDVAQTGDGTQLHLFFDPHRFFDPWGLPWDIQHRHRLGIHGDLRETTEKVRLAKWLGLKLTSSLYLYRVRKD